MRDDDRLLMHLPPSLGRLGNPTASISSNAAFVASIHRYRYQNILKMNISPFLENHTGPNMVEKYSKLIFGTFSGTGTYRTLSILNSNNNVFYLPHFFAPHVFSLFSPT
jgi:hypothetical protein